MNRFLPKLLAAMPLMFSPLLALSQPGPFTLLDPANNATVVVGAGETNTVNFYWFSSNGALTYRVMFDQPGGNFATPIISMPSNNLGTDTHMTVQRGTLDAALAQAGYAPGDTATVIWTVRAYSATDSTMATTPFTLRLVRRAPLGPFTLAAPAHEARIITLAGNTTPVHFRWTSSTNARHYRVYIDDDATFTIPLWSVASNNGGADTVLTRTLGELDQLLASWGLQAGDSIEVYWTAEATNVANETRMAQTPRRLTLKREDPALVPGPFQLRAPEDNATLIVEQGSSTNINFRWSASQYATTYRVYFMQGGNVVAHRPANNSGMDTVMTMTSGQLDDLMGQLGTSPGDAGNIQWTVTSYTATFSGDTARPDRSRSATVIRRAELGSFDLIGPHDTVITIRSGQQLQVVNFSWEASQNARSYTLMMDVDGDFTEPMISFDAGPNSSHSVTLGNLDSLLAAEGVQPGDTAEVQWTVRARNLAGDTRQASNIFNITFRRDTVTSMPDQPFAASVRLFPNPATDQVVVELPMEGRTLLRIMNAQGQAVADRVLLQQTNRVNVANLPPGLYFFNLVRADGSRAVKPVQVNR